MIDKELLQLVQDDLLYLKEEWDNAISDTSLRRSSNVLRNLLTNDLLGKASRSLDYQFYIETSSLSKEHIFQMFPPGVIRMYCAGGANYGGGMIRSIFELNITLQPEQMKNIMTITHPLKESKSHKVGNYLGLPAIIANGEVITKDKVIQYVANKKGGAHYDKNRKDSSKEMSYKQLDIVFDKYKLADKNVVYYELLSIGQEIYRSKSCDELIKLIDKVV